MTDQTPPAPEAALRALVDRAARGVATPAEGDLLRQRVEELLAERDALKAAVERARAVAEVIEANGVAWAADAVRGACDTPDHATP